MSKCYLAFLPTQVAILLDNVDYILQRLSFFIKNNTAWAYCNSRH